MAHATGHTFTLSADLTKPDDMLTVQAAAIYSKRSESSLRSKIAQGSLPCERVGPHGSIVISRRVLDALLFDGGERRRTR
jgi:hypothetical protein